MKCIRELRPKDIVISDVRTAGTGELEFTLYSLLSAGDLFGEGSGIADGFSITGIYDPENGKTALEVSSENSSVSLPVELSEEEKKLVRLAVTVHLWRQHHLLPADYIRYLTECLSVAGIKRYRLAGTVLFEAGNECG